MNEDEILWSYTAGSLREYMTAQREFYRDNPQYQTAWPDPASLTPEQNAELRRRIREDVSRHFDFPERGFEQIAYNILRDMGLITD